MAEALLVELEEAVARDADVPALRVLGIDLGTGQVAADDQVANGLWRQGEEFADIAYFKEGWDGFFFRRSESCAHKIWLFKGSI